MNATNANSEAISTDSFPIEISSEAAMLAARAACAEDDWDAVRENTETALEEKPGDLDALFLLGLAAFHQGDLALATNATKSALAEDPSVQEFAHVLSVYFALAGDINNSLYYGKLATALTRNGQFASLIPATFPRFESVFGGISENPLLLRARQSASAQDWVNAEDWYRQHLAFNPEDADAHLALASCLISARQLRGALESLRAARHVAPMDARIASVLGNILTMLGEFSEGRACHTWARNLAPDSAVIHAAALQDQLLDPDLQPAEAITESRAWGKRFGVQGEADATTIVPEMKDRLTVGYVVGNHGSSIVGTSLAAILAKHDPTRFETVGFGIGALSDVGNLTFQKCMDRWHDINDIDPITLSAMVAAEDIDILVDVNGLSLPDHLAAFGARMAPCQVSWLGAPAGTGLAAMDFVLSDSVIECDGSDAMVEKPVLLDLGTPVVSPMGTGDGTPARRDSGGIVFAADTNMAELNVRTVALWAHAMHAVPESTLLLRDHGFRSGESLTRLIALFGDFGLSHRVDVIDPQDPVEMYDQADITLMPMPCPRPQGVIEALWGGTPVICLAGEGRANRQATSLLHHLELEETMVAGDPNAFIDHAVNWANDVARRAAFRESVRDHLSNADALNPTKRARDLENALRGMWQRVCENS